MIGSYSRLFSTKTNFFTASFKTFETSNLLFYFSIITLKMNHVSVPCLSGNTAVMLFVFHCQVANFNDSLPSVYSVCLRNDKAVVRL